MIAIGATPMMVTTATAGPSRSHRLAAVRRSMRSRASSCFPIGTISTSVVIKPIASVSQHLQGIRGQHEPDAVARSQSVAGALLILRAHHKRTAVRKTEVEERIGSEIDHGLDRA